MTINLTKGENVNLSKTAPTMTKVKIGLGWNPRVTPGQAFDLDASAFLVDAQGKSRGAGDFVFYKNLMSADGSVVHSGDNLTGEGDGDDEVISVDLTKVPSDIQKVVFVVSIYEAAQRGNQSFGQVTDAFIRIVNADTDVEEARHDLTEDSSGQSTLIFGELYRAGGEWKFKAIADALPLANGQTAKSLQDLVDHYIGAVA